MENKSSFKFKLVDSVPYVSKSGKKGVRLIAYCSYGYIVNLFTTEENSKIIIEKSRIKNNDISEFVSVFYDNKTQSFHYILNIQ